MMCEHKLYGQPFTRELQQLPNKYGPTYKQSNQFFFLLMMMILFFGNNSNNMIPNKVLGLWLYYCLWNDNNMNNLIPPNFLVYADNIVF